MDAAAYVAALQELRGLLVKAQEEQERLAKERKEVRGAATQWSGRYQQGLGLAASTLRDQLGRWRGGWRAPRLVVLAATGSLEPQERGEPGLARGERPAPPPCNSPSANRRLWMQPRRWKQRT